MAIGLSRAVWDITRKPSPTWGTNALMRVRVTCSVPRAVFGALGNFAEFTLPHRIPLSVYVTVAPAIESAFAMVAAGNLTVSAMIALAGAVAGGSSSIA